MQAVLNNEKGFVPSKTTYQKPLNMKDKPKGKPVTMSGFNSKASSELEQLGAGGRRVASVTQYLKSLDTQLLMMQKTDEHLITRLKESEKQKKEIERRYQMNKVYEQKLAAIKKEEKRHLNAAKRVP